MKKLIFFMSLVMMTQLQGMQSKEIDFYGHLEMRLNNLALAFPDSVQAFRISEEYKILSSWLKNQKVSPNIKRIQLRNLFQNVPRVVVFQDKLLISYPD